MFTVVHINPANGKCTTLPILNLGSQYARNFHLSWLGFWVAFLSWFAFSPLIPQAVKSDLHLSQIQIGDSNIVSLSATLLLRIIIGPLVDRFGPRLTMASILLVGAIPSALAATVTTPSGLYIIRFFIGILGATFVPCQAWTTAFYDLPIVGRANALVAGWGNAGGGFTFIIMLALYDRLRTDGLSVAKAWRAAFPIVPLPSLIFVAVLTIVFGTDHPNGKWANRHLPPPPQVAPTEFDEAKKESEVEVQQLDDDNARLAQETMTEVLTNPMTWLPALAYTITFGFELAMDANLSNILFALYSSPTFGQTKAGYIASVYGLLNIFARPVGGYLGDAVYRYHGVRAKKFLVLLTGILQGLMAIALGLYIDTRAHPDLSVVIVLMVLLAMVDEIGNGAVFSLVPHCNPRSNGFTTGIVGAMGNLGGICFALMFRFQPMPFGKAFWIAGTVTIVVNVLLVAIRVPKN